MAGLAALEALTEKLYDFIQSMEDDGIVDHHFKDCYNLKDANGPFLFIELLTTYISDSETTLEEITTEFCLLRLEAIKGDFSILHNKLEAFLELERRIVTNDYQGC
ncbi:hypothetical protein NC653_026667 [Populus alba x Populus x berolinensis]|uniref:Histidine-containing phosphotransfer protein n=1 Tax=Populus alba x Populus x berolinensis TaxID=444605 RepID=A0AAD6MEP1_9ROSI|nr:hypothetical protein NC653_026667 [Populus alba x Populus x berolinensis]